MGAPKYSQIRRRVQADQRDKQARLNRHESKIEIKKYPDCNGMFDNCPNREEFDKAVSDDKSNPPEVCKRCVIFRDSEWYKQEMDKEKMELWQKIMRK